MRTSMHSIRQLWPSRKAFRALLMIALIYAFLRLMIQVAYISGLLVAGEQPSSCSAVTVVMVVARAASRRR